MECRSTHRQKLIKADLIVPVAVQFLEDLSDLVPWYGVAGLFEKLAEFVIADKSIAVKICKRETQRGGEQRQLSN